MAGTALVDQIRRLSVDDYHRMIDAGLLSEDERVELIEGLIVGMSPRKEDHAHALERLSDHVFTGLPADYVVRTQLPLAVSPDCEPEPDAAILRRDAPRSLDRPPATALLMVEVSRDSLGRDRLVKSALYATAGVPEYVIVDLPSHSLEVRTDPDLGARRYRTLRTLDATLRFDSTAVPGYGFAVADLFRL